jgi:small subunit ribosomal protein S21|tara:strand:+ start:104 stop:352 length:249 start_codon:yes stop_codon:yes gene_type:complete
MKKRKNFRRKPKKQLQGLQVEVYNNEVEKAMRILKRKVKDSNLFIDLRKKEYFEKPSRVKREKRNLAKLRNQYQVQKEKEDY